jgi:hypothetical protein
MTDLAYYLGITIAVCASMFFALVIWCAIRSNDDDHLTGPRQGGGTI